MNFFLKCHSINYYAKTVFDKSLNLDIRSHSHDEYKSADGFSESWEDVYRYTRLKVARLIRPFDQRAVLYTISSLLSFSSFSYFLGDKYL